MNLTLSQEVFLWDNVIFCFKLIPVIFFNKCLGGFIDEIHSNPKVLSDILMSKYAGRIKCRTFIETRSTEFSSAYDSDTYYHDHNMLDVTVIPQNQ